MHCVVRCLRMQRVPRMHCFVDDESYAACVDEVIPGPVRRSCSTPRVIVKNPPRRSTDITYSKHVGLHSNGKSCEANLRGLAGQ